MNRGYLIAADLGGTKTALALAGPGSAAVIARHVYGSRNFGGFDGVLDAFLRREEVARYRDRIAAACFAVAGQVEDNASTLTNLGWVVAGEPLGGQFGIPRVRIINDFAAAGQGLALLDATDILTLQAGQPVERGTRIIVGAGTGLGVGLLTWQEGGYVTHPSEAGHADFAPVDELQDRLLVHLRRTFGRVSVERIVSGPGLMRIFSFLQETGVGVPSRQLLEVSKTHSDIAALISEFAIAKIDPLAVRALDIFIAVYGAFAGNLALAMLAHGGIYVGGGIAPRIAAKLQEGAFMRAFTSKGRFSDLLASIPVHVIMNPDVGLKGALLEAEKLVDRGS